MSQISPARLLTPAFSMLCGLEALNVREKLRSQFPGVAFFFFKNAHKLRKTIQPKDDTHPKSSREYMTVRSSGRKGQKEVESVYRGEERPTDMLERTQPSHLKQIQHASRADMQLRPGASGREGER